jgi:Tfp pilus assembly PilM family ATPase
MITVGLDIGYDAVRLIAIDHTATGPVLHSIGAQRYDTPRSARNLFDHPDGLTDAIRQVMETYGDPGWPVTVGIRNRFAVFLLPQVEKKLNTNQREEWLRWEAGHFVDDSLDHYILDSDSAGYQTDKTEDVFLVAARREAVETVKSLVEAAGVAPAAMTVAIIALINSFEKSYALSDWETAALVHIEPACVDIVFIHDGQINVVAMPLDQGAGAATGLASFGSQFRFLINQMPEAEAPDTVYVSSAQGRLQKLCSEWGEQMNRRVTQMTPFQNIEIPDSLTNTIGRVNQAAFIIATGLAFQELD